MISGATCQDGHLLRKSRMVALRRMRENVKPIKRIPFAAFADWFAIGVAASLPWSTSATGILIALWLVSVLPTLELATLRQELLTPAGGLPILLWLLAAAGMAWAAVARAERFGGFGGSSQ